ncbi:LysR family transcriptional regulator [Pseudomonas aeruginosa]
MELRHLRYFWAVGQELHFGRAAEKLHIEQSPLSRAIKELEDDLGAQLLERSSRGTRLTWAGQVLMEDIGRIFTAIEQARANVRAAASGYRGTLRIALSDGIIAQRIAALLACCREEEPEVDLRLFEVPFSVQCKGLRDDLYDVGFARSNEVGDGIAATAIWSDKLVIMVPARHPLLSHPQVPLDEALKFPLVLCHPEACVGTHRQMERLLHSATVQPVVAEHVATPDLMYALVAAGYGVGFTSESNASICRNSDIVVRPLAGSPLSISTYLLQPDTEPFAQLSRFVERAIRMAPEDQTALLDPIEPDSAA